MASHSFGAGSKGGDWSQSVGWEHVLLHTSKNAPKNAHLDRRCTDGGALRKIKTHWINISIGGMQPLLLRDN